MIFGDRIYPIELEIKDTTDTDGSAWYLDLHLQIDRTWRLRTKLYNKRYDFNFPIVNFPFMCSNIPTVPAYGLYISQFIRYSRVCSYQDILNKRLLLTRKPRNQRFLLELKLPLRNYYGQHLFDSYGISAVSQMIMDMFHLSYTLSGTFLYSWLITGFVTRWTEWVPLVEQELPTLVGHLRLPPVLSGFRVTRSFIFVYIL